jgi:L-ascorbate metabolism protein UlaG (beta-lactamase superfamily)
MEPKIIWLGHASFRIEHKGNIIYIDPWKLKDGPKADIILITHSHMDHYSEEDIGRIAKKDTVLIGPSDVKPKISMTHVRPGDVKDLGWVKLEAHRAYNPNKQFHPKTNDWLGYVIDLGGYRIYHSGDTDIIAEMKDLRSIDVALMSIGGTYTMDPAEAAKAVSIFKPKLAIPMHWGDIIGDKSSADAFTKQSSVPTRILDIGH